VDLLRSVMRQESGFKPCAVSVAGAMGLMQIMPGTAEMLKLDDPFDPQKNVDAGASFLKMMLDRYQGNVTLALGAYNAGPGSVDKAGGVPPIAETMQYITNILGDLPLAY
jgi:soluble lytic murein transglycosylase-like protein